MHRWIKIGLGLAALLVILVAIGITAKINHPASNTSNSGANQSIQFSSSQGPSSAGSCSSGQLFSVLPIESKEFIAFRPLGFVTIPIHLFGAKHSNFVINQPDQHRTGVKVVFPANAVITQITSTKSQQGNGFQIVFYPCKDFKSYLFHLGTISSRLEGTLNSGKPNCQEFNFGSGGGVTTKCELKTEIKVTAGELVGTNDTFSGVDWGGVDYRVQAKYANPKRYDNDYPSYVSPIAYLTPELQSVMEEKLRSFDGAVKRTVDPLWGELDQDVSGTAAGNWFIGDRSFSNTQDFSPFLSLRHDYIDPTEPEIVMGTSVKGLKSGVYSFTMQSTGTTNRDFKDIKPDGQTYCFWSFKAGTSVGKIPLATVSGKILMEMPGDKKLNVEYQSGNCGQSERLTSQTTQFDR